MPPCESGIFKDNCYGEFKYSNGTKYNGEFVNDKAEGRGVAIYPKGGRYVGEFLNGVRQGEGTYYYPNGDVYRGQWEHGKRNGEGTLSIASGGSRKGVWNNGELLRQARPIPFEVDTTTDIGSNASADSAICSAKARLILKSSGYSGTIEVHLRKGNRPGSKVLARDEIFTSGTREFAGICPGKYFFSFATSDSSSVSITGNFPVEPTTAVAQMTVFLSRTKSSENSVQTISKKDL